MTAREIFPYPEAVQLVITFLSTLNGIVLSARSVISLISFSATVLMEPKIEYDHLVQVMDTVRGAKTPLFPKISIGDAP